MTETDIDINDVSSVCIPEYTIIPAQASKKVRLLLLIKNGLQFQQLDQVVDVPAIWIQLEKPRIVIGGIYRQFSSGDNHGLAFEGQQLDVLVEQVSKIKPKHDVCILGDLNLDMARLNDSTYTRRHLLHKWLECLHSTGIEWLPTGHTWCSFGSFGGNQRTSTLDHVYVSMNLSSSSTALVLTDSITDHFPVEAAIDFAQGLPQVGNRSCLPVITRRNFSAIDYTAVNMELQFMGSWPVPPSDMDPNDYLNDFYSLLQPTLDRHAPLKTFKVRRDTQSLFLQKDTRQTMQSRDRARAAGRRSEYKMLRNRVVKLVRRDRLRTIRNKIKASQDPSAEAWRIAKSIVSKTSSELPVLGGLCGDEESAEHINQYYIDKVLKLRNAFPESLSSTAKSRPSKLGFHLHCVGTAAIKKAIRSMNNTRALGVDGIPVSFWKGCEKSLALPITYLVNLSIETGIVPMVFKRAIVHPIFKGGHKDPKTPSSYRPVAILPALSKVLEKIIADQLVTFLEENHVLPEAQHGFRAGRSIVTAMTSAIHSWSTRSRLRTGDPDLGIQAFDFSAAFDTVGSKELEARLIKIGATETTRKWFMSYMSGGSQQVNWNGALSGFVDVTVGVRQGSILGPVVFILIGVDIPDVLVNSIGYADDNSAWACGKPVGELCSDLAETAAGLINISTELKLSLNRQKTQLMWVGGSASSDLPEVMVGDTAIKPGSTIEILGLQLDHRLSPAPYVVGLRSALAQRLGMLRRLRPSVPPHLLRNFAEGLFYGKLRVYANVVFNVRLMDTDQHTKGSSAIQVLINDVARLITGLRRTDHIRIRNLLDKAQVPSLNEVVVRASGMLAWSMTSPKHPLHHIYEESRLDSVTRSSSAGLLKVTTAKESISVRNAQLVWNACSELRSATSAGAAKAALKSFVRTTPL